MKKIFFIFSLWLFYVFTQAVVQAADLKFVNEFEGGKLYKAGKFNVLVLNGNYHQMGRQYGALMKDQMKEFYEIGVNDILIKKYKMNYDYLKQFSHSVFDAYPERFKAIARGMAETSGLDLDKHVILDSYMFLIVGSGLPYCTGMAAWGPYTSGGPLVFGRNWDCGILFKDLAKFLTIVVFNPNDGSVPTACIEYAGWIQSNSGMNKAGILIENNEGVISGGRIFYDNRLVVQAAELSFLLDSTTLLQIDTFIHSYRPIFPILLNVADKERAYSYECATFDVKRRSAVNEGLLVATNHYLEPSWGIAPPPDDPDDRTLRRRANLLAAGEKYKGKFSPKVMMKIFDTTIDNGGPTWPVETHHTSYQFVAVPAELKMWLKSPGYADWTEVELKELFE